MVSVLYLRRTRTLARARPPVPEPAVFFWLGTRAVVIALDSPVDELGEKDFFFVHMGQHVDPRRPGAALFVAGLTGPVLRPVLALKSVERLRFLDPPARRAADLGGQPLIWHLPVLYQAALHHDAVHALEHSSSSAAACLMWSPVLETLPAPEWFGTGWKLGYIVVVGSIETILGNVFIWSSTVFYP